MRITSPSRSGARRLLLAGALSVPLSALLLAGTASAAAPDTAPEKGASSSSAASGRDDAPGQQKKKADQAPSSSSSSAPAESAPSEPAAESKKNEKSEPAAQSKSEPAAEKAEKKAAPSSGSTSTGSSNGTSGTATQPQPLSNADKNGTGANPGSTCTHAYCSTRDGSPSLNGEGGGAAKGKPCAGCVGKADNKNPPGQAPDGTDRNNGYECDGNKGIGKGNPAHTGCKAPVTEEPPVETCPAGTPPGGTMSNGCVPPVKTCPAGSPAGATMADGCSLPTTPTTPPTTPPTTTTTTTTTTSTPPSGVLSGALVRPVVPLSAAPISIVSAPKAALAPPAVVRPTVLPFTGAELLWLLPTALIALAIGVALVGFGRRETVRV